MMTTHLGKLCALGIALGLLGAASCPVQAVFPVYFNVNFENETVGSVPGTNEFAPLPTALRFTRLDIEPFGFVVVTNNLFGNASKFALLSATGGFGSAFFTADIKPEDQPTNGILRVAMEIASATLLNTTNWLPLTFSSGGDITLDFRTNGVFHLSTAGGVDLDVGQYEAGKFTNVEWHVDLETRRFNFITGTNILLANLPYGGTAGAAFIKVEPGPGQVGSGDQFGIDNLAIQIIPEPGAGALLAAAGLGLATALRRRRC